MPQAKQYSELAAQAGQMRLAIQDDCDDGVVGQTLRLASYHLLVAGRELARAATAAAWAEEKAGST